MSSSVKWAIAVLVGTCLTLVIIAINQMSRDTAKVEEVLTNIEQRFFIAERRAFIQGLNVGVAYTVCQRLAGEEPWPDWTQPKRERLVHERDQLTMPIPDCNVIRRVLAQETTDETGQQP